MDFRPYIRDVPDFPKPGILFRDITPLLANPEVFNLAIYEMWEAWDEKADAVAALDARGFIFGAPLAQELRVPFIPIRKRGKLPYQTHSVSYDLEYGQDTVEMHVDACGTNARVLIVDDLLATGGTAAAAATLVEKAGATVAGYAFMIELAGLGGRAKLGDRRIESLVIYP
ncbi:MAG TPA: adenine phosphoribosyltransferase [Candidatus Paceibacterota bacterium]|nr:adenine phosphoribosyltransferase [Candidatus Paceibacterota bacterium]